MSTGGAVGSSDGTDGAESRLVSAGAPGEETTAATDARAEVVAEDNDSDLIVPGSCPVCFMLVYII